MRKLFPALVGQILIALVMSVAVAAFQARPGYFSTLTTGTLTATSTLTSTAVASGDAWLKTGDIIYSTTGTCRTGFTEYTTARGRYIVGLPSGGTNAGTVGTALSDVENRPVGQHTHTLTDPGHTHIQNAHTHTLTDPGHTHTIFGSNVAITSGGGDSALTSASLSTNSGSSTTGITANNATATNQTATTGVTAQNAGSVAGTNAPYVQLIACRKD